jgi:predicted permease
MSNLTVLLNLQGMVLLMMLAGYLARRLDILTPASRKSLTDLLLYIILPCNIVDVFAQESGSGVPFSVFLQLLLISAAAHLIAILLGFALYPMAEGDQKKILRFATAFSNANFFGLPIIEGLYGSQGVLYLAVFMIPLRLLLWSYGLHMFQEKIEPGPGRAGFLSALLHPCIVAVFLGALVMALSIPLPEFFGKTINRIGNCTTPVSLMVVGTILAEADLKKLANKLVLYLTFVRLLLIPLALLAVLRLLHVDPMITGVSTLLMAMPAATVTAALASRYDGDAELGAKCVVFSTLLSMITLPCIQLLL